LKIVVNSVYSGEFDPDVQEADSLATIGKGLELGINFLDTAWIYQVTIMIPRIYVAYLPSHGYSTIL
jgi:predicted aldo/keto reductase-like oxidoreductase